MVPAEGEIPQGELTASTRQAIQGGATAQDGTRTAIFERVPGEERLVQIIPQGGQGIPQGELGLRQGIPQGGPGLVQGIPPGGRTLFRQGQPLRDVYVPINGSVDVRVFMPLCVDRYRYILTDRYDICICIYI